MATMIPASGSAYTYTYVVLGELLAWIVGWSLILEYSLVVSAVAVGWSGYAAGLLSSAWARLPFGSVAGARARWHHQPAGDLHHLRWSPAC
jgi:APA family basic amino acid/polyamine antiporter